MSEEKPKKEKKEEPNVYGTLRDLVEKLDEFESKDQEWIVKCACEKLNIDIGFD